MGFLRFIKINGTIWAFAGWVLFVRMRILRTDEKPAQRFSRMLQELGTTFVKLGQAVGLRRDLLPDEFVTAMEGLQDKVKPFPGELAVSEITSALKSRPGVLFASFDEQPFAAASIAQVHRARLKEGAEVVVKVRRPNIQRQVTQDMRLLRMTLRGLQFFFPFLRRYQLLEIIAEAEKGLLQEMDFRLEAQSMRRFAEVFEGSSTISVPAVFEQYSTDSVLVQELSGGGRVDDPSLQQDGARLAKAFVAAYLHQFFVFGLFHGDPHPGNLFIMKDGRICFHDFGLVGYLDRQARRNLADFMQAFVHKDADGLLDAYLDLGILAGDLDMAVYRAGIDELLEEYARQPIKNWSFAVAFLRVIRMGRGHDVRIPRSLLVLLRTLFLMETTVRSLDPEFNLRDELAGQAELVAEAAFAADLDNGKARLIREVETIAKDIPDTLTKWLRRVRRQGVEIRLRHQGLEKLEQHLDRSSNRLSLALVAMGLYISSALLMPLHTSLHVAGMPLPALIGWVLAVWVTVRLLLGISRSGRL